MPTVPTIQLNDGNAIPQLGLGVWQVPLEQTAQTVQQAIAAGYTLIDTAQGYDNEEGVGAGIRAAGVDRDSLFASTTPCAPAKPACAGSASTISTCS